jgi:ribonuclease HII
MIGIDEVGRGAWAGPLLVVAAKLKEHNSLPAGLTDSKLLTRKQKEQFYQQLQYVCEFGEGWVSVEEIDSLGLAASLKLGAARAVAAIDDIEDEDICIDGSVDFLGDEYPKSYAKVKADITEPIVSAASVYAKVMRDKHMYKLHYTSPNYGFNEHVGYGTPKHIDALKKYGISEHHRKSFKPILELL